MKTIIRIIFPALVIMTLGVKAQTVTVCAGDNTTITAVNSSNLSNPAYTISPAGMYSSGSIFTVAPASSVIYTLFTTGTNSNSQVVTTSNTVMVEVVDITYALTSQNSFTLGCASKSICVVQITNIVTTPVLGSAVSFSYCAPGSIPVLPNGTLSSISSASVSVPGTWSVAVKEHVSGCVSWTTMNVSLNNAAPVIGTITASQNTLTCSNPTTVLQVAPSFSVSFNWLPMGTQGYTVGLAANPAIPTQSILTTLTLVATNNTNLCKFNTLIPVYQNIFKPTAAIIGASVACAGTTVNLSHSSYTGIPPGTFPVGLPVVGLLWAGPAPQPTQGLSSSYVAQTSGIYTLVALDQNNGCTNSTTFNLIMGPVAAFVHTITGGQAFFNETSTGTGFNTNYFWDFGDGNTSTLQNPIHNYLSAGAYLVKFKAKNNISLCTDSIIQSVNISGINCSSNSNFSMVPTNTAQVWNVIPDYPWNVAAASWSWGDGAVSNNLYSSHQYSAAGMYNICLSVTVSCGDTSTTCTSYNVYRGSESALILEVNVVAPALISGLASVETDKELSWEIYPNPNNGWFELKLNNTKPEPVRLMISDLSGRIMRDQLLEPDANQISINNSGLTSGMYLVTIESGQWKATKRMVVNH